VTEFEEQKTDGETQISHLKMMIAAKENFHEVIAAEHLDRLREKDDIISSLRVMLSEHFKEIMQLREEMGEILKNWEDARSFRGDMSQSKIYWNKGNLAC